MNTLSYVEGLQETVFTEYIKFQFSIAMKHVPPTSVVQNSNSHLLLSFMLLGVHQVQLSSDHLDSLMNLHSAGALGQSYPKGFLFLLTYLLSGWGDVNSQSLEQLGLLGFLWSLCLYDLCLWSLHEVSPVEWIQVSWASQGSKETCLEREPVKAVLPLTTQASVSQKQVTKAGHLQGRGTDSTF